MARIRLLGTRPTITVVAWTPATNVRCWVIDWKTISPTKERAMTSRIQTSTLAWCCSGVRKRRCDWAVAVTLLAKLSAPTVSAS